ncbi:MAG: tyrosine--tRNA ligase [Phycisphaerae bacterium]|jgi:tyrosyl-tRNA synthetase|nr:tyrosine--tRNA ligase [Phycisphaerae bacterium]
MNAPSTQHEQLQLLLRGCENVYTPDELAARMTASYESKRPMRVKLGLDPTAPDIHLGHTVVLRKMRQFQDMGHKAVLIIGDYTARIGDPSGVNKTRPILTSEQIDANAKTYFEQAGKILDTSEDKLEIRYNSEWLEKLSFAELIQLAAKKTVAQMIQRDSFKKRLDAGEDVFLHEMLYPIMQGYDSVCIESDVELGGTDQTFNNLVGRDLQKASGQKPQIVLVMPILVGLDGTEKMSKSKGNYIGVTDEPNDMFGKVMSIPDTLMDNYFTLLTDLPVDQIAIFTDPSQTHPKQAKVELGKMIVAQYYDAAAGDAAAEEFDRVFKQHDVPADMLEIAVPAGPIGIVELICLAEFAESRGQAKRLVKQGAVSIDARNIASIDAEIEPSDGQVLKVGKRRFGQLKVV